MKKREIEQKQYTAPDGGIIDAPAGMTEKEALRIYAEANKGDKATTRTETDEDDNT